MTSDLCALKIVRCASIACCRADGTSFGPKLHEQSQPLSGLAIDLAGYATLELEAFFRGQPERMACDVIFLQQHASAV